ncbi:MAG: hypothetical protein RL681_270 [Candidatus Parcubacteria bacterium]
MREKVLAAIKRGDVTMRPKWHFVLRAALMLMGSVFAFLALLYVVSFILFVLWRTGAWFVPVFGMRGILAFLLGIPWMLVFVSLALVIILELLVKHYAFAHRKPLLYSVLGITAFAFAGGLIVAKTTIHPWLYQQAMEHRLPVAGQFYEHLPGGRVDMVYRGSVTSVATSGFILAPHRGEPFGVYLTATTSLPYGFDFVEGDTVVVFGEPDGDLVHAIGVREIDPDDIDRSGPPDGPRPFRGFLLLPRP